MKIKYLGPSAKVNVHPFGEHRKFEVKDYPDDFAEDMIATRREHKFEIVEDPKVKDSRAKKNSALE